MATLTESARQSDWLAYQSPGGYGVEVVTLLAGSGAERDYKTGKVLGKASLAGGVAVAAADAGNTGNGTISAVVVGDDAKVGLYELELVDAEANGGGWVLRDPAGDLVGVVQVGEQSVQGGLTFTISDGSTDFALEDKFTIDVQSESEKWVELDTSGADGRERAAGVLLVDTIVPDGSDKKAAVLVHGQHVIHSNGLGWPAGITAVQKRAAEAQLRGNGFVFEKGF